MFNNWLSQTLQTSPRTPRRHIQDEKAKASFGTRLCRVVSTPTHASWATVLSFLNLEHFRLTPTLGPLHLLFPLLFWITMRLFLPLSGLCSNVTFYQGLLWPACKHSLPSTPAFLPALCLIESLAVPSELLWNVKMCLSFYLSSVFLY